MSNREYFTADGTHLPPEQFVGRVGQQEQFANQVGYNIQREGVDSEWAPLSGEDYDTGDWAWVIEGHRGLGKSAFGSWCVHARERFGRNDSGSRPFIVASASPDLCVNGRHTPLEAALYRLRRQVLNQLGRVADGTDFGWLSAGEVLHSIAEEAAQKGYKSPSDDSHGSIVFILDNVSILPRNDEEKHYLDRVGLGPVEQAVAALISELSRLPQGRRPRIGLIALTYPGFYSRVGYALTSRFLYHDVLTPFAEDDITALLAMHLNWRRDEELATMAETLFDLSGGIPVLVQAIMQQAWIRSSKSGESAPITDDTIKEVGGDPGYALVGHMVEQLRDRKVAREDFSADFRSIFEAAHEIPLTLSRRAKITRSSMLEQIAHKLAWESEDERLRHWMAYLEQHEIIIVNEDKNKERDKDIVTAFSSAVWNNMLLCTNSMLY